MAPAKTVDELYEAIRAAKRRQFIHCAEQIIGILDDFTDHENPDSEVDEVTGVRYDTAIDLVTMAQKALLEIPEYRAKHGI